MSDRIVCLRDFSEPQKKQAAVVLMDALAHVPSAWHTRESALAVVEQCRSCVDRFGFGVVVDESVVGWIGAIRHSIHQWELHPLVVAPDHQRKGYGATLVQTLEREARRANVCTIWLGTDDEFGGTNIYGMDLYPNVLEHLSRLAPANGHPYTFYQRLGFSVVGVLPDADGFGKHDIIMAKQIDRPL